MHKLILIIFFLVSINRGGISQVTMQPVVPSIGLSHKDQLWNVLLVNSSGNQHLARIEMSLKDRITGMEIMSAITTSFTFGSGAAQFNVNTLNPIRYNFVSAASGRAGLNSLLPAGSYMACYTLWSATSEIPLAEECVETEIEPFSPPVLVFPVDSSELEISPYQFSWLPPTPASMFTFLRYEVSIVPLSEGQHAEEAVNTNTPFHVEYGLKSPSFNYPATGKSFEKGKWYAWTVTARNESSYSGKTETWVFRIRDSLKNSANENYLELVQGDSKNSVYVLTAPNLNIRYYSRDKFYRATISIRDLSGNLIQTINQDFSYGNNSFSIPLKKVRSGESYFLAVTDAEAKSTTVRFRIK